MSLLEWICPSKAAWIKAALPRASDIAAEALSGPIPSWMQIVPNTVSSSYYAGLL